MVTHIPNTIKINKVKHGRKLRFEPPLCFFSAIAMCTGNERAPIMFIQITNQEKEKSFLYNPIESVESYINMLTSYDSLKKGYLTCATIKESEISTTNKNKYQKDGKVESQELYEE